MRALIPGSIVAVAFAGPAFAHGGHEHSAEPIGWTWDPWITVPLALSALIFAFGWRRLRARSTLGSDALGRRAWLFAGGWLMLAAALVSPLHDAGERSFTAHMTEHELLMLVAAPLLVLSQPLAIMLWAFSPNARRAIGRISASRPVAASWKRLTGPVTATAVQAAALWLWHAPALFDRALANEGWHAVQHLSFVLSALFFWTAMLGRRGGHASTTAPRALAALCLFATSVISGALGALMAFAQSPWYAGYARLGMAPFGLTPAEDQQLAGLIMWVPGGLVHAAAALVLVRGLLTPARRTADAR
jgi:putative membrane protein